MITVGNLIKELEKLHDPDLIIVMSRDEEGNGFSPLCDFSIGQYTEESAYSGDFLHDDGNWLDININAICLWPLN